MSTLSRSYRKKGGKRPMSMRKRGGKSAMSMKKRGGKSAMSMRKGGGKSGMLMKKLGTTKYEAQAQGEAFDLFRDGPIVPQWKGAKVFDNAIPMTTPDRHKMGVIE